MENGLKKNLPYSKTVAVLFGLSFLAGILTVLMGELLLPISAALLASLLFFEKKTYKPLSLTVLAVVISVDTLIAVWDGVYVPFRALAIAAVALIMFLCFVKSVSKGECAFYLTAAILILLALNLVFSLFTDIGEYSFAALGEYLSDVRVRLREETVSLVSDFTVTGEGGMAESVFSAEVAMQAFDLAVAMIPAIFVIFSFLLCGLSLKFFSALMLRLSEREVSVIRWRFTTTKIVAIFYAVLMLISIFVTPDGSLFPSLVYNLYYIFMMVYAYIGFSCVHALMSLHRNHIFMFLLLLLAVIVFSSFSLTLLSIFGAFLMFSKDAAGEKK